MTLGLKYRGTQEAQDAQNVTCFSLLFWAFNARLKSAAGSTGQGPTNHSWHLNIQRHIYVRQKDLHTVKIAQGKFNFRGSRRGYASA